MNRIEIVIVESLFILASIAFALLLGAMSPGPTYIYVAKNSIAISRKHGLFTALGTVIRDDDGSITLPEVSQKVNLEDAPVFERIRKAGN